MLFISRSAALHSTQFARWGVLTWSHLTKTIEHIQHSTVRICYSVRLWFLKIYHYNRGTVTSYVHGLRSNRKPLFPAWAYNYPWKRYNLSDPMGCRDVFQLLFFLKSLIFLPSFADQVRRKRKLVEGEKNSEMLSTGLHCYCYIWHFFVQNLMVWFFSISIVISDILSLQPICTGYSDFLYVFLRFWFWFLSILP